MNFLVEKTSDGIGFGCGQGAASEKEDLGVQVYLFLTREDLDGRGKVVISLFLGLVTQ